ncbi:MAG: glutamate--tRNA ligase, partial [Agromyces sp.]
DVFSREEFAHAFDVANVNPNPARFDLKKAEALNSEHVRKLDAADFAERIVPYLAAAGLVSTPPTPAEAATIASAAPLIQERTNLLGEAPGMLGFLFRSSEGFSFDDDALASLGANAPEVLTAAREALARIPGERWIASEIEEALRGALIDGLGLKPRDAFGPVRVATSGRRVSPPLFESLELLGPLDSLARIDALSTRLG